MNHDKKVLAILEEYAALLADAIRNDRGVREAELKVIAGAMVLCGYTMDESGQYIKQEVTL